MAGRRCAEWRFPTAKQAKAEETARRLAEAQRQRVRVDDEEAWWAAVLDDPRAAARPTPLQSKSLGEIRQQRLRVACFKCFRVVEITRDDAIARYDSGSAWKNVAMHLLADGCQHRTGRHEEDGCWPDYK